MTNYKEMQDVLMKELRLYHYPIAVYYFYDQDKLHKYIAETDFIRPVRPLTYCQMELMARMKGDSVLAFQKDMGCGNSTVSFGWNPINEKEIESHAKYTYDLEQAERFLRSKPHLKKAPLAIAVGPLGDAIMQPSVIHFYCDNMQAYHLSVDYMAGTDTHPLRPMLSMNSAACGGGAFSYTEDTFNLTPSCSGSYNSGKTERGEINVFIPGSKIQKVFDRLKHRLSEHGRASITRPGDPLPGADICKNCPLLVFKKGDKDICKNCTA